MIYTNEKIKERTEKKLKIKKIIIYSLLPFALIIIAFVSNILYQKLILKKNNIEFFGYKFVIAMKGNMEPNISIGDIIVEKNVVQSEIAVGDIITYNVKNNNNQVTNRVSEIIKKDGKIAYKTKNDNNNTENPDLVYYDAIEGKMYSKIQGLGNIVSYVFTQTGLIVFILIVLLQYFIISGKKSRTIMREEARKLYNIPRYKQGEG